MIIWNTLKLESKTGSLSANVSLYESTPVWHFNNPIQSDRMIANVVTTNTIHVNNSLDIPDEAISYSKLTGDPNVQNLTVNNVATLNVAGITTATINSATINGGLVFGEDASPVILPEGSKIPGAANTVEINPGVLVYPFADNDMILVNLTNHSNGQFRELHNGQEYAYGFNDQKWSNGAADFASIIRSTDNTRSGTLKYGFDPDNMQEYPVGNPSFFFVEYSEESYTLPGNLVPIEDGLFVMLPPFATANECFAALYGWLWYAFSHNYKHMSYQYLNAGTAGDSNPWPFNGAWPASTENNTKYMGLVSIDLDNIGSAFPNHSVMRRAVFRYPASGILFTKH